jgi:hypothetical protein
LKDGAGILEAATSMGSLLKLRERYPDEKYERTFTQSEITKLRSGGPTP